jgi:hypothetical protein
MAANVDGTGESVLLDENGSPTGWFDGGFFLEKGSSLILFPNKGPRIQVALPQSVRARVSPDGKYVAYDSGASGRREVYVEALPPGSGRVQISLEGGLQPWWRRDGKELFFRSLGSNGSMLAVDIATEPKLKAGIPHPLFPLPQGWDGAVHPDGQRFLYAAAGQAAEIDDNPITVVMNWWVDLQKR